MEKIYLSESELKKIVNDTVKKVINEGLFGPFGLGHKNRPYKGSLKAIESGTSFRTIKPNKYYYHWASHTPKIDDEGNTIYYKNSDDTPVMITYIPTSGFYCKIGENKPTYVDYNDMLFYRERGWICKPASYLGPDYRDKWEISKESDYTPIENISYQNIKVYDFMLAQGIYSWCLKTCKNKKHIQFLKDYLKDEKQEAENNGQKFYGSAYRFFLDRI